MMENYFNEAWQKLWQKSHFSSPSCIQEKSFSILKNKQSAVLISPTGSGKTLAYLWPLLLNCQPKKGTQLCIILPSQELAMQVVKIAREWGEPLNLKVNAMVGGGNIRRQIEQLKKHPEVIIGTPGRVLELINRKKIRSTLLQTIVFDEVDELLKDESEHNLCQQLMKKVQKTTQKVAVSATANHLNDFSWMGDYQVIDVTEEDESQGTITNSYLMTPLRKRGELLRKLSYVENFRALVFFKHVSDLGAIAEKLLYDGVPVATLASDQSKFERQMALSQFNEGKVKLLLTTDVASRGLDLKELDYIVHYDIPEMQDQYIHRIGRIGRMGRNGLSLALVNERELRNLKAILPENMSLIPLYLHGSVLYDTPVVEEKSEKEMNKQQNNKAKIKQEQTPTKGKKKKVKNKKKKNKGARRKGAV